MDKWGHVYRAAAGGVAGDEGSEGGYAPRRVAYVGPGRPLGFTFDAQGRLLICNCLQGQWTAVVARLAAWLQPCNGAAGAAASALPHWVAQNFTELWHTAVAGLEGHCCAVCSSSAGLQRLDLATGTLETLANRVSDDSPLAPGSLIRSVARPVPLQEIDRSIERHCSLHGMWPGLAWPVRPV